MLLQRHKLDHKTMLRQMAALRSVSVMSVICIRHYESSFLISISTCGLQTVVLRICVLIDI